MAQMCVGQPGTPTNVVWKGRLVRNLPDRDQQGGRGNIECNGEHELMGFAASASGLRRLAYIVAHSSRSRMSGCRARCSRCRRGRSIFLSFLEDALRHLELPARGGQSLRENLPDLRVFIWIVDFRATGIRHQSGGEGVQVVVPSAQLHEPRRRLAAVEVLVVPLQRRNQQRSFLPIGHPHLALLSVLERSGAELRRPQHAESAAVQKDDRRARPVAVGALVSARGELLHVQGHGISRHRKMVVIILDSLARGIQRRLPRIWNVVDDGVGVVALNVDRGSLARDRGMESRRLGGEVILAAVETLRENIVVVENEIGVPEHVDQQRGVGDRRQARRILAGIDVAVPGVERRGKYGAFFPLEGDHVALIALPNLGLSLAGEDQYLLFENVALRVGPASRRNLAYPRIDRSRRAFQEDVRSEGSHPLPWFQLDLVDVDETALVDGNSFFLEELPIGAGSVENERVIVGIGPGPGGPRRLSLCPRTGGNRSGGDSRQAHAQKLRSGKTYLFDGVPGGFAVRMTMRRGRVSGAVGMIVVLVMRVLMTVVGMTVVVMSGMIHVALLKVTPV